MKKTVVAFFAFALTNCTPQQRQAVPVHESGVVYKNPYGEVVPRPKFGATKPDTHEWRGRPKITR